MEKLQPSGKCHSHLFQKPPLKTEILFSPTFSKCGRRFTTHPPPPPVAERGRGLHYDEIISVNFCKCSRLVVFFMPPALNVTIASSPTSTWHGSKVGSSPGTLGPRDTWDSRTSWDLRTLGKSPLPFELQNLNTQKL